MSGEPVAEGVWLLTGRPEYRINQYLIGDVLIDSGTPAAARRLLRDQLALFGHGPPLRDPAAWPTFATGLPA
jgi:hypothetical protein